MEALRLLPDLCPQLRRRGRRRRGRHGRHRAAAALPPRPRRRLGVDHAVLHLAAERPRLRRRRLPRRGPAVRLARRLRLHAGEGARPRPARDRGPGPQPHLQRAPVVPRGAGRRAGLPRPGPLRLPRRRRARRQPPAEQLAVDLRRPRVDPRPGPRRRARPVVPAHVRPDPAGPELVERRGRRRDGVRAPLLARPRRGRLPDRRRARPLQPPRPARQEARPVDADVGPARGARGVPPLAQDPRVRRGADGRRGGVDEHARVDGPLRPRRRAAPDLQLPLARGDLGRGVVPPGDHREPRRGRPRRRERHLGAVQPRRGPA